MTRDRGGWPAIAALATELADDRLTGAACAGRAPLFDAEVPGEDDDDAAYRLAAAARVCRGCPVRDPCRTVAGELGGQAVGVWAARTSGRSRPRGRPPKTTDRRQCRSAP